MYPIFSLPISVSSLSLLCFLLLSLQHLFFLFLLFLTNYGCLINSWSDSRVSSCLQAGRQGMSGNAEDPHPEASALKPSFASRACRRCLPVLLRPNPQKGWNNVCTNKETWKDEQFPREASWSNYFRLFSNKLQGRLICPFQCVASELCSSISRSVLTTPICSEIAPCPPAGRAPALRTYSLPCQGVSGPHALCGSVPGTQLPGSMTLSLRSWTVPVTPDTAWEPTTRKHCAWALANGQPSLHLASERQRQQHPSKCKFSFCNTGYKINQHCRACVAICHHLIQAHCWQQSSQTWSGKAFPGASISRGQQLSSKDYHVILSEHRSA